LPLSPPASRNLLKLRCFGAATLTQIQDASSLKFRFFNHVRSLFHGF
jgi:hypothetical protein